MTYYQSLKELLARNGDREALDALEQLEKKVASKKVLATVAEDFLQGKGDLGRIRAALMLSEDRPDLDLTAALYAALARRLEAFFEAVWVLKQSTPATLQELRRLGGDAAAKVVLRMAAPELIDRERAFRTPETLSEIMRAEAAVAGYLAGKLKADELLRVVSRGAALSTADLRRELYKERQRRALLERELIARSEP